MDLPKPPADIDLKNIIDKLAQFVARNGPEFEQMTKNKQKDNPKFSFLFGGEMFNYYQYKVTTEQAILKSKASRDSSSHSQQNSPMVANPLGAFGSNNQNAGVTMTPLQIMNAAAAAAATNFMMVTQSSILEQQNVLQQQITQSEQNLAAQHSALLQTEEALIEDAIRKGLAESLSQRAEQHGVNLVEFNTVLQPIIDSCTKDSISSGKAWILGHTSQESNEILAQHLLHKVTTPGVIFNHKLHIIYLINDVMHHCVRKNAEDLKRSLEEVVAPMFCNTWIGTTDEQKAKLSKLLSLWENKNNYFRKNTINQLKHPEESWAEYQAEMLRSNDHIVTSIKLSTQTTYESYRAQHQIFVNHALSQIQSLESQKQQLEQQEAQNQLQMQIQPPPPPMIAEDAPSNLPNVPFEPSPMNILPPNQFELDPSQFSQPPPGMFGHLPPELLPDFSKPPPGFQAPIVEDLSLIPSVPYYELPAGLMVPLIRIDDFSYKSLDPCKMRLPPAIPPSEHLMQAVEAFYQRTYSGDTRERLILDADGWEKLGLYEYYKEKNAARKRKEVEVEEGLREQSRSPSPIRRERSRSLSPKKKRCYKSKSPSPVPVKAKSRSRSRSRTPPPSSDAVVWNTSRGASRHHRSSNGKRSPRRSRRKSRSKSRSRSKSASPPSQRAGHSPSPPSFLGGSFPAMFDEKLDETNKGHQMLKKMGWGGAGLGSKEQGIEAPISGGEIRDRTDQYKGVGVSLNDPYENFRKNKGQAFITRMRARAEERETK